jgi:hypothetical protein
VPALGADFQTLPLLLWKAFSAVAADQAAKNILAVSDLERATVNILESVAKGSISRLKTVDLILIKKLVARSMCLIF